MLIQDRSQRLLLHRKYKLVKVKQMLQELLGIRTTQAKIFPVSRSIKPTPWTHQIQQVKPQSQLSSIPKASLLPNSCRTMPSAALSRAFLRFGLGRVVSTAVAILSKSSWMKCMLDREADYSARWIHFKRGCQIQLSYSTCIAK